MIKNFGERISVLSQELEVIEPELRKSYSNVEVIEQEMKVMKSMIKEIRTENKEIIQVIQSNKYINIFKRGKALICD
jgi:septum formation inhibitor-activating ATPase MinD